MNQKKVLSTQFNMSLGFLPAVITMTAGNIVASDIALYIGSCIGLLACALNYCCHRLRIPQILLCITTAILCLLMLCTIFMPQKLYGIALPFVLEVGLLAPPLLLLLLQRPIHAFCQSHRHCSHLKQGMEATFVSSRIVCLLGGGHLMAVLLLGYISAPVSSTLHALLFLLLPPLIFIIAMFLNQWCIGYFNRELGEMPFLPIVTPRGEVTGKVLAEDIRNGKSHLLHPVIRIAVIVHGMLYLQPRKKGRFSLEAGKTDLPLESCLAYGESLEEGVKRIVTEQMPQADADRVEFNIRYRYESSETNRLVYLYLLELEDETIARKGEGEQGKPWTFSSIEQDLGKGVFSSFLENEYEHLKSVICTRGKYRESWTSRDGQPATP